MEFCSQEGCRQAAGPTCQQCGRLLCGSHARWLKLLDFQKQDICELQVAIESYLRNSNDVDWSFSGRASLDEVNFRTYKVFYTRIAPHVGNLRVTQQVMCWDCLREHAIQVQQLLLRSLVPLLDKARRSSELCDIGSICLFDSDTRCSKCGKARCREHAAACEQCSQVFCCDHVQYNSSDYSTSYHEAQGGCARDHKHSFFAQVLSGQGGRTFHWKRVY